MNLRNINPYFLIAIIGVVLYFPFLGGVPLFDWDEVNFAECAREMIASGNYVQPQIDFQPFWEKPPLFFWLQAAAMHLLGVGEYAARLPNAITGILTLLIIFRIGSHLVDKTFGWIWMAGFMGSVLPGLYFKSGIIDPVFNLLIFLSLYFIIRFQWESEHKNENSTTIKAWLYWLPAGLLAGLALLTKGPAAAIIIGIVIVIYLAFKKFRSSVRLSHLLVFALVAIAVFLAWYSAIAISDGFWFIEEFTAYQYRLFSTPDAGHGGFPGFHLVVLLIGCFPVSVFAIRSLFQTKYLSPITLDFRKWLIILLCTVLVLFSIVQSKIIHYSSLAYFPLTFLAALSIYNIVKHKTKMATWEWITFAFIGLLYVVIIIAAPWMARHPESISFLFDGDAFATEALFADANWTGWEIVAGLFLFLVLILFIVKKKNTHFSFAVLFGGMAIFVQLVLVLFIGKIERHVQGEAIDFYKGLEERECYVTTFGFKSYAHLFYFKKPYPDGQNKQSGDWQWLIDGPIDKPAYFVTKSNKAPALDAQDQLDLLYRKNGYSFYVRDVPR